MFLEAFGFIISAFGQILLFIFNIQLAPNITIGGIFIITSILAIIMRITLNYLGIAGVSISTSNVQPNAKTVLGVKSAYYGAKINHELRRNIKNNEL